MKARIASVAGSVIALVVVGGFAAAATMQPAPEPVAVVATVAPAVTVAPVVVTTTQAPAPVESTTAPAPVVAPKEVAPVAVKTPAPKPIIQTDGNDPAFVGRYANGDPVKRDAAGSVIPLPRTKAGIGSVPAPTP